jgi:thymidine kinase
MSLKTKVKEKICPYCRVRFIPKRPQDVDQKFCKAAHRAEFYKNPFNQLVQRCETAATAEAMEAVSEFCQDLLARVERLENRKQRPIKEANIEDL